MLTAYHVPYNLIVDEEDEVERCVMGSHLNPYYYAIGRSMHSGDN